MGSEARQLDENWKCNWMGSGSAMGWEVKCDNWMGSASAIGWEVEVQWDWK